MSMLKAKSNVSQLRRSPPGRTVPFAAAADGAPAHPLLDDESSASEVFSFLLTLDISPGCPTDDIVGRRLILTLGLALARGENRPPLSGAEASDILRLLIALDMAPVAEGSGRGGYNIVLAWIAESVERV